MLTYSAQDSAGNIPYAVVDIGVSHGIGSNAINGDDGKKKKKL